MKDDFCEIVTYNDEEYVVVSKELVHCLIDFVGSTSTERRLKVMDMSGKSIHSAEEVNGVMTRFFSKNGYKVREKK